MPQAWLLKDTSFLVQKVATQETTLQERIGNNVNVRHLENKNGDNPIQERVRSVEDMACASVLAQDIFEIFRDHKSREFYTYAAIKLIDYEHDVRFLLSTIKQDVIQNHHSKVQNPAALFVTQLQQLARDRGVDL